ncbi:alpha beta hydrolase [Micractinium conductrix]|uniref:Alpha beta hydrolase n=1 Tax=Micractinium conductrix TaxID=554055 RepID=A0A2P6VHE7_9CHLO|nr:alpha beta hydrolase [Micractinium conductrix]|eukprot:PSC73512.1 alpha beta hydrolase [Micractinium conductrix]
MHHYDHEKEREATAQAAARAAALTAQALPPAGGAAARTIGDAAEASTPASRAEHAALVERERTKSTHLGLLSNGQPVPFLGPLRSVKAAGIEWGYHTFGPLVSAAGAAPPLLLLPGTASSMYTWPPELLTSLAANRSVTIVDLPGVSATQAPGFNYSSLDDLAKVTLAFVKAAPGLKQPDVIAWSLGGSLLLRMAELAPGGLGRLVLVAPFAGGPDRVDPVHDVVAAFASELARGCDSPLRYWAQTVAQFSLDTTRQQALMMVRFIQTPLVSAKLHLITNPVLIVHGKLDKTIPVGNARALAAALTASPQVVLRIVAGAAHAVAHQLPGWFAAEVLAFLSGPPRG